MTERTLNLKEFVEVIRDKIALNHAFDIFNETVNYYDMSLGGCGCSRKTREQYAEDKFIDKINKTDNTILIQIKPILGLTENDFISFIKKDGSLIKKV